MTGYEGKNTSMPRGMVLAKLTGKEQGTPYHFAAEIPHIHSLSLLVNHLLTLLSLPSSSLFLSSISFSDPLTSHSAESND